MGRDPVHLLDLYLGMGIQFKQSIERQLRVIGLGIQSRTFHGVDPGHPPSLYCN